LWNVACHYSNVSNTCIQLYLPQIRYNYFDNRKLARIQNDIRMKEWHFSNIAFTKYLQNMTSMATFTYYVPKYFRYFYLCDFCKNNKTFFQYSLLGANLKTSCSMTSISSFVKIVNLSFMHNVNAFWQCYCGFIIPQAHFLT